MRFTQEDVQHFAGWSGDRNPLHIDADLARRTWFGRTVVHGMLTVIRTLNSAPQLSGETLHSLDVEFRSPVYPGQDYSPEFIPSAGGTQLALRSDDGVAVAIHVNGGMSPLQADPWPASSTSTDLNQRERRDAPADYDEADLQRGIAIAGVYATPSDRDRYTGETLTSTHARVLALCSYLVGMEVPGLRSLFTHMTVQFGDGHEDSRDLRYRARTVRFDPQFRMLDTRLEVATAEGRIIAVARIRSYVRFSPVTIEPAQVRLNLDPSTASLAGRVALVCGGSRGLGGEITAGLALAGCRVYASFAADGAAAEDLSASLDRAGVQVEFVQGDAGDPSWCESMLQRIVERHGGIDILVLNACGAPTPLRISSGTAAQFSDYITHNLKLAQAPIATFLHSLEARAGTLVCISSSFVADPPAGFAHYVALKQAVEGTVRTAARESRNIRTLIARPPRLRTAWNDTPTGVLGTIPARQAAVGIVNRLSASDVRTETAILSDFPALTSQALPLAPGEPPEFTVAVTASFTPDPLIDGLRFWFTQLGVRGAVEVAPYGQVLQTLLDPARALPANTRGLHVVMLRLRDWLRELTPENAGSEAFLRTYLQQTARDFERAVRAHRAHASAETLLLFCPSAAESTSAGEAILEETEAQLSAALTGVPGLQIVNARGFHEHYDVDPEAIADPVRDHIAHLPYQPAYFHTLSTIAMRQIHRRLAVARKVVVVDCDNTLWQGVVGEAGAEGVTFDQGHAALHTTLARLHASGVLIALCSKNEEADVWRVFDTRNDFGLKRDHIVASTINWQPKSENLRALASRLNVGLDSFLFLDDNPVECAEVRSACPQVLTLEWPQDPQQAIRLLRHTWELDPGAATAEDLRRTELYREEFRRQELQAQTLTFRDFIDSLALVVDIAPLAPEDLRRAAQLTLRTNQFNFTTRRREESELRSLAADGSHEIRTVRVRDRFGDYGLVGLLIAELRGSQVFADTFLLSCRVLGRGVEHQMAAELGRIASAQGAASVLLRVEPTKRNTPARKFLEAIAPAMIAAGAGNALECGLPAETLATLKFDPPADAAPEVVEEDRSLPAGSHTVDGPRLRARELQISRTAYEWSTSTALLQAIEGRATAQPARRRTEVSDVDAYVFEAFSGALGLPLSQVKDVDRLDALGCDSFKIVEITVNLLEKYPWLPSTLLFEHRSVSEIAARIAELSNAGEEAVAATSAISTPGRHSDGGDIAVVGMHLRCAGAQTADELWDLLSAGRTAVAPVPSDRKYFLGRLDDTRPHSAGLLDDVDRFDADLFGITPREAELMDPQLRLFLEVAWGALEDAGGLGDGYDASTGVFAGVMYGDYGYRANLIAKNSENPYKCWEGFSLANRLSQVFGFRGPSLAVDTACSSSGTAVHLACRALNAGDCDAAIAGGVNLILDPDRFVQLGRLGILSLSGRCLAFGAEADGTVLGEGAGAVVLRRLADAERRGDRIYGVIKATGVSTGSGTVGFTAPNPQAQAEAIRRSVRSAGIDPRTITYVETHGTGTLLGDPIEVRGLTLAYTDRELWDGRLRGSQRCTLGSIKPNVGHLEAGAGVIALIKVLLQLTRGELLPSLTSEQPNAQIPFAQGPFEVQRTRAPWSRPTMEMDGVEITIPRRAGLSSFGVGGANAHLIVEEAPAIPPRTAELERTHHILTASARTAESLRNQLAGIEQALETRSDVNLADLCFSANGGRRHFEHRVAVVAGSRTQMVASLRQLAAGDDPAGSVRGNLPRSAAAPKTAFLFTGQGSQYAGMGKLLYDTQPVFRDALHRCAGLFESWLDVPLLRVMFANDGSDVALKLNQTGFTQPALFAFEYALSQLWGSWGIRPDVVIGHSVGEIAALCVAGGVSLEDGVKLIAARGRLMQALPGGGAMTSFMCGEERVRQAIAGREDCVAIAAINGPEQVVISGDGAAVADISAQLIAQGIKAKNLIVSHAFHSPLMTPMVEEYQAVVRQIRFLPPRVSFVSCVHGRLVDAELTQPEYWLRNVTDPVRFTDGMAVLGTLDVKALVEIGPQPVLLGMGRQCLAPREDEWLWLPSIRKDGDPWPTLLGSLGTLYAIGAAVDWNGFDAPYFRTRVNLPPYPFAAKRYWISGDFSAALPVPIAPATTPAHGPINGNGIYEIAWRKQPALAEEHSAGSAGHWLVFADRGGAGARLAAVLEQQGARCTTVLASDTFEKTGPREYRVRPGASSDLERVLYDASSQSQDIRGVVHMWSLDTMAATGAAPDDPAEDARQNIASALPLLQLIARDTAPSAPRVWIVTSGAAVPHVTSAIAPVALAQSALWGMGRTFALEYPAAWGGLIDLPGDTTRDCAIPLLARELLSAESEDQIALRDSERYAPRLVPKGSPVPGRVSIVPDGVYLITGGTGALGLHTAHWLVSRGARRLVLASRRGSATPETDLAIGQLRSLGATVSIVAADVARPADLDVIFEAVDRLGPLRGIVHAAGVDTMIPINDLTPADVEVAMEAKAAGAWHLHERTKDVPLDFLVFYSSIASILGSAGRAAYAAANAFLDGLAYERSRVGSPALSVNWGPWAGGGMATESTLRQFERIGNHGLNPDAALQALEGLLDSQSVQAAVADITWPTFRTAYEARGPRPFIAEVGSDEAVAQTTVSNSERPPWIERLRVISPDQRAGELVSLLRAEIAQTLGFDGIDDVPLDRTFHDMGMDSLMSADFAQRLQKRLGIRSTALVFDFPIVGALATHLLERIDLGEVTRAPAIEGPPREKVAADNQNVQPQAPGSDARETTGYAPEIEPDVFAFQRLAWPRRQADLIAPRWRWMFVESAKRLGVEPRVWLHRDAGVIVGHNGAIPVRVKIADDERVSAWLVDTMVLEEYRSQAVGARLMVEAHEDVPFALSLGQTDQMRAVQLKLGWEQVGPLQTAQLLIRPERVLKGKLPTAAAFAAGLGLRASSAIRDARKRAPEGAVREIARFDASHDRLWEAMAADLVCAVRRDASYLNWKYVDQRGQDFLRLELQRPDGARGVAVCMFKEPDEAYRYRRAFLVDLIAPLNDVRLVGDLIQVAVQASAQRDADAMLCLHIDARLTNALRAQGFRLRAPERFLLVRPGPLEGDARRHVLSAAAWYVTHGDSDIDRPW